MPTKVTRTQSGQFTPTDEAQDAVAQNDIADVLYWLRDRVGADTWLGKLLDQMADAMEGMDGDETRARLGLDSPCIQAFLAGLREDATQAARTLGSDAAVRVQDLMNCAWGGPDTPATVRAQAVSEAIASIDVGCIVNAVFVWIRTRDIQQAVTALLPCILSAIGGGGGTGGGTSGLFSNAKRC